MSFLTQSGSKRLLAIHGWAGVILGLLLYICIFTGAISVFEEEIDTWSQGALAEQAGLGTKVDRALRQAGREIDPRFYEELLVFRTTGGDLWALFHGHERDPATGRMVERGVQLTMDTETGEVLDRWEGLVSERPRDPGTALRRFWVELHVQLYLPAPYGLILTGILGLMMMAAAVSGILLHKHLIRDAFVAARSSARLVGARDLHVLAGTWSLPFAILLAFTGAFFSLAGTVGVPIMAMVAFNGDQDAMIETIIGLPEDGDLTPASMASLDYLIADAETRSGGVARSLAITNYGSESARVTVRLSPAEGNLSPTVYAYEGTSRAFLGEQPVFGQQPSLGASLFNLIGPLHFGNFAGLLSRLVWLGLGLASAWVTATGLLLWTKRREAEPLWQRFRHLSLCVIWGLPLAMLVSAGFYFLSRPLGDPHWWTPLGFLAGTALVWALGRKREGTLPRLARAAAILCLGLPVLRHLMGGSSWSEALIHGAPAILVIDLLFLCAGLWLWRGQRGRAAKAAAPASLPSPAE